MRVRLPSADIKFLDSYAEEHSMPSRSAVLHKAVTLLREASLAPAYEEAWAEWVSSGDAALWDATTGDGVTG